MGIELVLPQSRSPAVEKKRKYYMGIQVVLPQSRTPAVEKNEKNKSVFKVRLLLYLLGFGITRRNL